MENKGDYMIHVMIREMHGETPYLMEVYSFDNLIDATFFANDLALKIPDHQWIEID
jgi:hypothetical protein